MADPKNPYILLTPGPLSTTASVKETMLRDWCTWDDSYNHAVVEDIRRRLVELATKSKGYTTVLMQGSGTFAVESTIGTMMPKTGGKLLVLVNGAYGARIVQIAQYLGIDHAVLDFGEINRVEPSRVDETLTADPSITHVALVHNETTTGMLNPLAKIAEQVRRHGKLFMVDAMSSFGGIPMDIGDLGIDFLVSSSNKCIQGVPGFGFVICKKERLATCEGNARSLSLDLYDQWKTMENQGGKWRFTSPTHVVRAFQQAMNELDAEGGVIARFDRYYNNQRILVEGMERLGFKPLLAKEFHSPIITSFYNPVSPEYDFAEFYNRLKRLGFVIYPGKVSVANCFRIGTIGDVTPEDIRQLIVAIEGNLFWK